MGKQQFPIMPIPILTGVRCKSGKEMSNPDKDDCEQAMADVNLLVSDRQTLYQKLKQKLVKSARSG